MFQIGVKKFLRLKTSKTLYRGHMLLVILKAKKFLEHNYKKRKKSLKLKTQYTEKVINYILNEKATIVLLTVRLMRKT